MKIFISSSKANKQTNKQTNKASDHFSSALVFWSAWFACAASSVPYVELPTTSTTSCLSLSLCLFHFRRSWRRRRRRRWWWRRSSSWILLES
jgi:hypothetical protein